MTAQIGYYSLVAAMVVAVYAAVMPIIGVRLKRKDIVASGERAAISVAVLLVASTASLLYAFLTRDFSIQYVYEYSNRALSTIYTISSWWAGNQGSLLMWAVFLSIYTAIVVVLNQHKNRAMMPYVTTILSVITFFFTSIIVFMANPFIRMPYLPADGQGLNPMLHNPGMYMHPPSTYLGYVGFAVPFAFAMAALITGKLGDMWIRTTRRWVIWGWFWLTVGNLIGAWWAYYTLGWGGFWGWDPVENASFMPWLVGSAYMHSVMIQEKKGMLKIWNMALITITFSLTIYGTFITRSGIITSVHTFSNSGLGPYLLFLLLSVIFFAFGLILYRLPLLKTENNLESILSRESAFLFNNLVLLGVAFMILWGVTFPFISEAVTGNKITMGIPYYNQMAVPLGLALLFLIGFCPLIAWRRASVANLQRNFLYPLAAAAIGFIVLAVKGITKPGALTALVLIIFVLTTIFLEFYRGTRARHKMTDEDILTAFINLIWRNKRRYGGYIVHIGLIMVFVALSGGPYKIEKNVVLKQGSAASIGDYRIVYNQPISWKDQEKEVLATSMIIYKGGKKMGTITPRKEIYSKEQQPWTRVSIKSNLKEDVYIILEGIEKDGSAGFKILINPLMQWMWIAGFVMTFGTIIAYWPDKAEKRRLAMVYARQEALNAS